MYGSKGYSKKEPVIPLPARTREIIKSIREKKDRHIHPTLELSKFVAWEWEIGGDPKVGDQEKSRAYGRVINEVKKRMDLAKNWLERLENGIQIFVQNGRATFVDVECRSGAVLWLAAPTPLELGFCLHHTYGLPYLPGSALKGVARRAAMVRNRATEINRDPTESHIFGEGGDKGWVGNVDFLDGIPLDVKKCLEPEVMTPHHPKYYQGKERYPHDCESPTPLHFMRIRPGARFRIALVCRNGLPDGACPPLLKEACDLLLQGLRDIAIGGKTTSGYGVFELCRADFSTTKSCSVEPVATLPQPDESPVEEVEATAIRFDKDSLVARSDDGREFRAAMAKAKFDGVYPRIAPKSSERIILHIRNDEVIRVTPGGKRS